MLKGFYYALIWPYFEAFSGLFEDFGGWLDNRMQRWRTEGFTLVEMSMVLVIIGLLVGSVLVGQIMIKQAETQAQITQIQKYDSAVNTFKNKYNGIPGDLDVVDATNFGFSIGSAGTGDLCSGSGSGPSGARNGDGLIQGNGVSIPLPGLMGENVLFWEDLSSSTLIDGTFPNGGQPVRGCVGGSLSLGGSNPAISTYLPLGKIGYGTFLHAYSINGANWYLLAQFTSFSGSNSFVDGIPTIPVAQAYNIDKKIDDGLPTTGIVQAVNIVNSFFFTTPAPNGNPDTSSTCYNNSTNTYSTNISNGSGPNCALSFKMQGAAR